MKTFATILACIAVIVNLETHGQNIFKRTETRAKQKGNNKIDRTIDKGLDKTEDAVDNLFKKKKKKKGETAEADDAVSDNNTDRAGDKQTGTVTGARQPGQSASFLDFIPGNQVIFSDNFEKDALMDFPAQWNSTGSGKVVTIEGVSGKWFEMVNDTYANPVMDKALPENCTIEFDLFLQSMGQLRVPSIFFGLTEVRDIVKQDIYYKEKFYTKIGRYNEIHGKNVESGIKFPPLGNKNDFPLTQYVNKILRVSIAVNNTRIRVYLDQTKIVDLPRVLTPKMRNNFYFQNGAIYPASQIGMFIGNIRIAAAETDARSLLIKQLMEEGKAVTSDILFDVNSDVIKPESYGVIKQFGDALTGTPSLKIKIVGHTDSDGAEDTNLTLSQKRAAAVKMYITENFAVAGSRIQTDGKGENQPAAPNTTTEGKAKNRRVEFIKL